MQCGWVGRQLFLGASAATVLSVVVGRMDVQKVTKPLIAPALAITVIHKRQQLGRIDFALLLMGLGAATIGDILLIDPDDDQNLMKGASSFAVMQSAYSAILFRQGARPHFQTSLPRAVAWVLAAAAMARRIPQVAIPLSGYGGFLSSTATLSADSALASGGKSFATVVIPGLNRRSWLGIGGVVFSLSDALIIFRKMFLRSSRSRNISEGMILATYALAQFLLVEGMLALAGRTKDVHHLVK
ncbi:MAG: lysoplasmalogenase family protein [Mycobacteriaceae bacterium]